MKAFINFNPGPSQLYFTAEDHIRKALRDGIPSLSHRSKSFEKIFQSTTENVKALFDMPADWNIVFTSSATEVWERAIENLTAQQSHHLVNGAFSHRFYEIAQQLNRKPTLSFAPAGEGFSDISVPAGTELIAVTHNETSTGVSLPVDFIHSLKSAHPETLVVVDAVSSLPYVSFDYARIDSVFFSVQKGFGMPAGLGVWCVNDRCINRAEQLLQKGKSLGSYHSLPSLLSHAKKFQTPETPNVMGIYVLGKVAEDMLRRGISMIRRETEYKAAILYQALEQHAQLTPFVNEKAWQSKTVILAESGNHTERVSAFLCEKGIAPGDGYGKARSSQLRFANFPAHSKEQYELLVDTLAAYAG